MSGQDTSQNNEVTITDKADEQKAALDKAKAFYGPNWRKRILWAWTTGDYRGLEESVAKVLQSIRDDPDRNWEIDKL